MEGGRLEKKHEKINIERKGGRKKEKERRKEGEIGVKEGEGRE